MNDATCRLCRRPTRTTRLDSTGACEECHPIVGLDVVDRLPDDARQPIEACLRKPKVRR